MLHIKKYNSLPGSFVKRTVNSCPLKTFASRRMPIVLGPFTCSSRNILGLSYYLVLLLGVNVQYLCEHPTRFIESKLRISE